MHNIFPSKSVTQYFIVRTTQPRPNKNHFSVLFIIITCTRFNRAENICKSKDANSLQFGMIQPEIFFHNKEIIKITIV